MGSECSGPAASAAADVDTEHVTPGQHRSAEQLTLNEKARQPRILSGRNYQRGRARLGAHQQIMVPRSLR